MTDHVFDRAAWDERYRSHGELWSGHPNRYLISEVADLAPSAALDVGCGEGADAIWLAERGWTVTAVDFSSVALARGATRAAGSGPDLAERIEWLAEDVTVWDPPQARYGLVSAQYLHLPTATREAVFGRLAGAVAPGGTLLIVGHHPSDLQTSMPRPPRPELFFTAEELADALDGRSWEIVTAAAPGRSATDPQGRDVTVHEAVLRARRR